MNEKPDFSAVPITALESLRLRLSQVTHALTTLHAQVAQPKLPQWVSLHDQLIVVETQIASLAETMTTFSDVIQRTVAYPIPNFPVLSEAGLLTTLLRKKNSPEVQEWIENGHNIGKNIKIAAYDQFTLWAKEFNEESKDQHEWSGVSTRKQIESNEEPPIQTSEDLASNGWSIDDIIKYMSRGENK